MVDRHIHKGYELTLLKPAMFLCDMGKINLYVQKIFDNVEKDYDNSALGIICREFKNRGYSFVIVEVISKKHRVLKMQGETKWKQ